MRYLSLTALFLSLLSTKLHANEANALPAGSRLQPLGERSLHIRSHAPKAAASPVEMLLLSGPTDRWHSDSAWFALLQPVLASAGLHNHAIDRPGHGYSTPVAEPSYSAFGQDLVQLLPQLTNKPVVLVAFASSNLAVIQALQNERFRKQIKGVLLLDPDALAPELLSFYAEQAGRFKAMDWAKTGPWLAAGNYDVRAKAHQDADRKHVDALLAQLPAELAAQFDRDAFNRISERWTSHAAITARWQEIGRYDTDIHNAAKLAWPAGVPVWVLDSDFEGAAVAAEPDNAQLKTWREQSSVWMRGLPGVCYLARPHQEHLLPVIDAALVRDWTLALSQGKVCPASKP